MVAKAFNSNILPPTDPDVRIPAGVKAAAAKADAAFKAAYGSDTDDARNSDQVPPAGIEPPQTSAGEPAGATESRGPPQDTPKEQVAPASSEPASSHDGQPNWEHRFNSMQGRYNKSQESIKQMSEQIVNLQNVLATIQSAPPQPAPNSELQFRSLLSPQEVSEYGEEFLDVVGKKAQEATNPLVQGLKQEIDLLKQQLGHVGGSIAQNERQKMFSILDEHLPDWRQVNNDPRFLQWLALPDTYSGAIRHNLLKAAWERNDTPRAAAFFQGFLAEEAAVDPAAGQPNGSQAPQNGQGHAYGKVPLDTYAAPGRAKSAAGSIPAEKPQISRSQISTFYAQCAAGKYRGNEQEKNRLEKMIFDAQAEGRITG